MMSVMLSNNGYLCIQDFAYLHSVLSEVFYVLFRWIMTLKMLMNLDLLTSRWMNLYFSPQIDSLKEALSFLKQENIRLQSDRLKVGLNIYYITTGWNRLKPNLPTAVYMCIQLR